MPHYIFIADDNQDFVLLFCTALSKIAPGCKCVSAENGFRALSQLNFMLPSVPDFIFIDLKMPIMDGYQIVMEIRKIHELSEVPVTLYSSGTVPNKISGVDKVFLKPHNLEGLTHLMHEVFNLKELK